METILRVIKQEDYDRYVFATYEKNQIIGLNFHQGLDEILWDFANPCSALTDIYERLADKNYIDSEEKRINKAIELFTNAFIFKNDEPYTIQKEQRELIKKALDYYIATSEKFNQHPTQDEAYEIFDMMQLSPMMNYPIQVVISEEEKNAFSKHGIDFPMQ